MTTKKLEKVSVDWKKVSDIISEKGMTMREVSYMCGKNDDWLSREIRRDATPSVPLAKLIAKNIGAELDDVVKREEEITLESLARQVGTLRAELTNLRTEVKWLYDRQSVL